MRFTLPPHVTLERLRKLLILAACGILAGNADWIVEPEPNLRNEGKWRLLLS